MRTFTKNADVFERLTRKKDPLEKTIEKKYVDRAKKHGWLAYKFSSPMNSGVPDRIFIRDDVIFFIEFKRKNKKATKLQKEVHVDIHAQGFCVLVIDHWDNHLAEVLFI